jgi:outer membrane protein assembly factor BamB
MNEKYATTAQHPSGFGLPIEPPRPRRKMRWWMPALIVLAAAGVVAYFHLNEEMDNGFRNFLSLFVGIVTLGLLTLWYLFFSGLSWGQFFLRTLVVAGLLALFYVGVVRQKILRFEGTTGNMLMRFSWAWTPHPGDNLPELKSTAAAPAVVTANAYDFPQFLGPTRQAVVTGVRLARDWSVTPPREVWRQEVGLGWGSFAVQGPLAITQEQRGDKELTVCRDTATGTVYWTHQNAVRFSEKMGGDGPRATPTIAGSRVYVLGATGILDCLELTTGNLVWSTDTLAESGSRNLNWGKSSSPLVVDDLVVVSLGEEEGDALAAYDKDTGKRRWKAATDRASYCSPVLATLAGRKQIISVNAKSVTGYDVADGKELWNFPWPNEMAKASQPVPLPDDRLLLTCGYGGADCPSALVLEFQSDQGRMQYKQVWGHTKLKTKFTTAVVRDGFAYALDDGVLACFDVTTGVRKWKAGRYGHGQVLLVEDLLLVQAEEPGDLILAEANPQRHVELGRIKALESKTWNNPALSGRYLFVRNDREAVCYELPLEKGENP